MGTDLGIPYEPPFYVYALRDPATRKVGYVGVTQNPKTRTGLHWTERLKGTDRKAAWLRALAASGKRPELVILEVTTAEARLAVEEQWIVRLAAEGHPLTNTIHLPRRREAPRPHAAVANDRWDDWVTMAEAAAIRGIHRNNIWKAINRGSLKAEWVRGRWLPRRDEVLAWQPVGHRPKKTKEPPA